MASDRRFGLPHPLDPAAREGSSGEKKNLWDSLKRAIGGSSGPPEKSAGAGGSPIPLPGMPGRNIAEVPLTTVSRPEPSETLLQSTPSSEGVTPPTSEVPFLDEAAEPVTISEPPRRPPETRSSTEAPRPTERAAADEVASPGPARLARGLASFSRDNAEREKRFSHLLRDSKKSARKAPSATKRRK